MEDDDVFVYGILQDDNIGYMVLKEFVFPEGFESEFERAVYDLMNTDGLIIDLRGNPGGDFDISDFSALAHLVRGTEDRYYPCTSDAHYCECFPVTSFRTGINGDESGLHHDYEVWLERVCSRASTTAT
jgi:hypothetical protein